MKKLFFKLLSLFKEQNIESLSLSEDVMRFEIKLDDKIYFLSVIEGKPENV